MRHWKHRRWLTASIFGAFALGVGVLHLAPLPERIAAQDSRLMRFSDGQVAYVDLSSDDRWRIAAKREDVAPDYIEALIAYEDKRFRWHPGVDPLAIGRAAYQNIRSGRVVSGASTLTMQVVRILEQRPRTLASKVVEAFRAMQLEYHFSKDEILQLYLRFAPFGRNVEGVRAASFAFFGHDARDLSETEIAFLIAVPQDPSERYPSPGHHEVMREAVGSVAQRLREHGVWNEAQARSAVGDALPRFSQSFPRLAPHVMGWIARSTSAPEVDTTIDAGVQSLVEEVLQGYKGSLRRGGIYNASVVVMESATGAVRGAVGNLSFWDREHDGQVLGFFGRRSPGSTLKPFIFAQAIDDGELLPSHLIEDIPIQYGSYAPKNYDETFRGLVTARDALSMSLNVPFVNLLKEVGVPRFVDKLRTLGAKGLHRDPSHYGLSAAIGGIELNLMELTSLYAMLANDGEFRQWWLTEQPAHEDIRGYSPEASYLTRAALRRRGRPGFPYRADLVTQAPRIFWKTGTSFGHRDAWSLGAVGEYTVGVWLGNFDGTPSKELVGSQRAGPILFDILEGLARSSDSSTLEDIPPEELGPVEVCEISGHLPTEGCTVTHRTDAPLGNVPTKRCSLHRRMEVDPESGGVVSPLCAHRYPNRITRVLTVFPPQVSRWVENLALAGTPLPEPAPGCEVTNPGTVRIGRPIAGSTLFILPKIPVEDQEVPFEADGTLQVGSVHWFVDGALVGKGSVEERIWWKPSPGRHEIRLVDSEGRADRVHIEVKRL